MAILPSNTLWPFALPRLVDAVRATPGRDMVTDGLSGAV